MSLDVSQHRIQQTFLTNQLFRGDIRMIPTVSFAPVQDRLLTFDEHSGIDEPPAFNYFETTYIAELQKDRCLFPLFSLELWNMHKRKITLKKNEKKNALKKN